MKGEMKGYCLVAKQQMEWVTKPIPEIGDNDALVKPIVIAPCTSDVHLWEYGNCIGVYQGHEAVAEVVEIGCNVTDFKVGDKVCIAATTPSWKELECQTPYHMHSGGPLLGCILGSVADGVFAEYVKIRDADQNLALLPEGMDIIKALMVGDMISTGFHGSEMANVQYGESVAVLGTGPVGLMALAGARMRGAGRLIAVETRPCCIDLAKFYGASDIVDFKKCDVVATIMEMTCGKGVDNVIITTDDPKAFEEALYITKPGGDVSNLTSWNVEYLKIPMMAWPVGLSHKTIHGGLTPGGRVRMETLLNVLKYDRLDPSKAISHIYHGMDKLPEAYKNMCEKPEGFIKPAVFFD